MIGVVARDEDRPAVREFFELFKTPWEFAVSGTSYEVALVTCEPSFSVDSGLAVTYTPVPGGAGAGSIEGGCLVGDGTGEAWVAGPVSVLSESAGEPLLRTSGGQVVGRRRVAGRRTEVRFGYDLPAEVRRLLGEGQDESRAEVPSLDGQIAILRRVLIGGRAPFVEVLPSPHGHPFTVCLSHDVDHPRLALHRWDRTAAGFFLRATLGSLKRWRAGELNGRELAENVRAALALPFIYLGFLRDPWRTFNRFSEIEAGGNSTYFVIPFARRPGKRAPGSGVAPPARGAAYGAADIEADLAGLRAAGDEVALHGIDAWADAWSGREERRSIESDPSPDPVGETGVRMHWLYSDPGSFRQLENAGFTYDSTFGYNSAVGCRAGTFQAFRPLGCRRLLEAPLHLMDTALFYPDRLGLTQAEGADLIERLTREVGRHGGLLAVNWHDRSLAPERQWTRVYRAAVAGWKEAGAWFPTMGQAVRWFRSRRDIRFDAGEGGTIKTTAPGLTGNGATPAFTLRVYDAASTKPVDLRLDPGESIDVPVDRGVRPAACGPARSC